MNDHTTVTVKSEVKDFHPLVAQWLTDNGYEYQHEVDLPDFGRADFLAKHKDGHNLIVECKITQSVNRTITQLRGYAVQIENPRLVLAIPGCLVTDNHHAVADRYGVEILKFDVAVEPAKPWRNEALDEFIDDYIVMRNENERLRSIIDRLIFEKSMQYAVLMTEIERLTGRLGQDND